MRGDGSLRRGVTLVELILVIVITTVLAAVAVPRMVGMGAWKLEGATRRLVADLRYTQRLAMGRQTGTAVSFNPPQGRYRAYDVGSNVNLTDPISGAPGQSGQPWTSGLAVDYDDDPNLRGVRIQLTTFGNTVQFNTIGRPADGNGAPFAILGQVTLQYGSQSRTITIETTGKVWTAT